MEVMKEVEHHWFDIGKGLHLGSPQLEDITSLFYLNARGKMEAVVKNYVKCSPTPSWKDVAVALQEMNLYELADEVTTKYVKGMDVHHVVCSK